jgi:hypothetical protein
MSQRERIAVWSTLAAVIASAAAASILLDVDVAAYAWLQQYPEADIHTLTRALDLAVRLLLVAAIAIPLGVDRRLVRGLPSAALLIATGAAMNELLKTILERLRPTALPALTTGNSLPSGHIMNTTLFAVVAWDLAGMALSRRTAGVVRAMAVAAVVLQCASRVLRGSHWPSDVPPSILLGIAWMLGARGLWQLRGLRAPLAATAVAAYALFWTYPALRLHVPSALDRPRTTLATWRDDASTERPESGLRVERLRVGGETPDAIEAVLRSRCEPQTKACDHVRLAVNGWTSPEISLECGWRWVHVRPPTDVLHRGANDVALFVPDECAPRDIERVAVQSLALIAEAGEPAHDNDRLASLHIDH